MSAYSDYMAGAISEADYGQAMLRERGDDDDQEFCLHCAKRTCIRGYCRWGLYQRERNEDDVEEDPDFGLDEYFPDPDDDEDDGR